MKAVADKLTLERFRANYADCKPYYELLDGQAVQKGLPTKRHALLPAILSSLLTELGFKSMTGTDLGEWR